MNPLSSILGFANEIKNANQMKNAKQMENAKIKNVKKNLKNMNKK